MKNELDQFLEAVKADYLKWEGPLDSLTDVQSRMYKEFCDGLHIVETQLYYRVHTKTSVHSFIVKNDGPQFKRGDILKAAGYNTPAKNQARGNLFTGYRIRWTGAAPAMTKNMSLKSS